MGAGWSDIMI
jgi:uncharacterized protein YacL